jgi:hypothetical protein
VPGGVFEEALNRRAARRARRARTSTAEKVDG